MFWTEEREQLKDSNNRIFSGLFGRLGNSELCRKGPRSYDWDSNGSKFIYYITDRTQIRQIKSDKNLILYYFTATRPIQSLQQLHGRR